MLWEEKKLHAVVIPKNRDMLIGGDVMTHQKYTTFVSKQHITSSNFCLLFNSTDLFICSFTVRGGIHVRDVLRPSVASHRPTGLVIRQLHQSRQLNGNNRVRTILRIFLWCYF